MNCIEAEYEMELEVLFLAFLFPRDRYERINPTTFGKFTQVI